MRRFLGLVVTAVLLVGCGSAPSGAPPIDPAAENGRSSVAANPSVPSSTVASLVTTSAAPPSSEVPTEPTPRESPDAITPTTDLAGDTTTLPPPPKPASVSEAAAADEIVALLAMLAVKGRAPKTGYDRAQFGPAWTDDVAVDGGHNGCDTRNDILRRDLVDVVLRPNSHGCAVLSGVLHDPYTAKTIAFTRGQATSGAVQIDHLVALSDAWQKGAQGRSKQQRENLANDPLNLQAVDGPTNAAKGDGDAATWLPPNKSYRCTYVSRQVQVKAKYGLWVTQAEKTAIERVLATCGATIPSSTPGLRPQTSTAAPPPYSTRVPVASTTTVAPQTTRTAVPSTPKPPPTTTKLPPPVTKSEGCHPLSPAGNCYKPGQFCAKKHRGMTGIDAFGEAITCVPVGGRWRWERG